MSQENLVGQALAQYQLRELLGAGGMGSVYRAYQVNLKREVAVKIISHALVANNEAMARFIREAEISARLEHPNIVPIHDFGTTKGITYVVMRLLTGGSLARRIEQRIEENRPLTSLGEASDLLKQVASGIDYAHSYGVIHRDIKPANIMFDNQGKPYVVDFGIAKLTTGGTSYTQQGTAIGTPNYMSPEQWRGDALTPQADQYALAVMIYQLLTGRMPFEGDSAFVLMHKHLNENPTPLNILRPDIPPNVIMVLNRALAKDYRQRFQSCTAFSQTFESAIEGNKGQSTGMFVFKVNPAQTNAIPISNRPYTPTGSIPAQSQRINAKHPLAWGLGLIFMAVFVVLLVILSGGNGDSSTTSTIVAQNDLSPTTESDVVSSASQLEETEILVTFAMPTNEPSPDLILLLAQTQTHEANLTETAHPTITQSPTTDINATLNILASQTAQARPTSAPTDTPSATVTVTTTPTPSPTLDETSSAIVYSLELTARSSRPIEEQTALSIQDTATVVSRYAQQTLAAFFVTETAVYPVTEMAITLQAVQTRVADIQAATATYLAENTDEAVVDIEVTPPTTPNILLVASEGVTLYRESDVRSEALLSLIINDQFTVYGIAPNGRWLYVENEDGIFGWIDRFANNNLNSVVLGTPIEELPMLDPENPSAPSEELFGVHLVVIGDLSINVREYAYFEERANIFAGLDQFEVARIDATTPNQSWLRVSFVNARNRITNGWVSATLSTDGSIMIVGNLDDVRKINPLPLPTVTPSTPTTPTATPTETETLPATEEPPAEPPTDP